MIFCCIFFLKLLPYVYSTVMPSWVACVEVYVRSFLSVCMSFVMISSLLHGWLVFFCYFFKLAVIFTNPVTLFRSPAPYSTRHHRVSVIVVTRSRQANSQTCYCCICVYSCVLCIEMCVLQRITGNKKSFFFSFWLDLVLFFPFSSVSVVDAVGWITNLTKTERILFRSDDCTFWRDFLS